MNKSLRNLILLFLGLVVSDPSELWQFVTKDKQDGKFHCTICNVFSHPSSGCTRNHVEAKHFPKSFSYECSVCSQTFHSKNSLNTHTYNTHKATKHK